MLFCVLFLEKSTATSEMLLDEDDERSDDMDEEEGKFTIPIARF